MSVIASAGSARAADDTLIRVHRVTKTFQRGSEVTHALSGIDLTIARGEYLCVMGPSGSGKSTFFNMLGGLDAPTTGRVFMDEVEMAQLNARELAFLRCRKIGYVFQSYNLNTVMTALENVTLPMTFAGVHTDEARQRGMTLLARVGLQDRWSHRPKEMSGGQQQRVAIARALANAPALLLCDEPTANLDAESAKAVHAILQDQNREHGVTVVAATHDHDMLQVSDRMLWIEHGKVKRIAASRDVVLERATLGGDDD